MATKIFISYAEQDADYASELDAHLALLKRDGVVRIWHRATVGPGIHWEAAVRREIQAAHIIIVLMSSDFLASDRCWDAELRQAAQRAAFGQVQLILVPLRPCVWGAEALARAYLLPRSGKPIVTWDHRDQAWEQVVQGVIDAVRRADIRAGEFAHKRQLFRRDTCNASGLTFLRASLDRTDDHWVETTMASPFHAAPFGVEDGQHILLRDLYIDPEGGIGLNLDITVMNQSSIPLVLTKVGIEIIAVALLLEGHGEGVPAKVLKADSYVLELPDVREILHCKFPTQEPWSHQGPTALDLVVSTFIDDPVLLPPMTPYRYGLLLSHYGQKMPNHALIRAWADTSAGASTSTCINIVTY